MKHMLLLFDHKYEDFSFCNPLDHAKNEKD